MRYNDILNETLGGEERISAAQGEDSASALQAFGEETIGTCVLNTHQVITGHTLLILVEHRGGIKRSWLGRGLFIKQQKLFTNLVCHYVEEWPNKLKDEQT